MLLGPIFLFLNVLTYAIIARALMSWFQPNPQNPLVRFLRAFTEPLLRPLRALVSPAALGGLDVSPILALIAIQLLKNLLVRM